MRRAGQAQKRAYEMARDGMTRHEITKALGISKATLRQYLFRHKKLTGDAAPINPGCTKREAIWAMAAAGTPRADIAVRLDISRNHVRTSLYQTSCMTGEPIPRDKRRPVKRELVVALKAQGLTRDAIAARLGMTEACVRQHLYLARRDAPRGRDHVKTFPAREGSAA